VVLLLLKIKYFSSETVFAICTITHGAAFAFYSFFYYYESKAAYTRYDSLPDGDYKNDAV
jgi:hypothetical protein